LAGAFGFDWQYAAFFCFFVFSSMLAETHRQSSRASQAAWVFSVLHFGGGAGFFAAAFGSSFLGAWACAA
jgi:hypothetical protein